jgi:hypothetical protein
LVLLLIVPRWRTLTLVAIFISRGPRRTFSMVVESSSTRFLGWGPTLYHCCY